MRKTVIRSKYGSCFFIIKKKGETNMSEELKSMVQSIELYGRGLRALGCAICFSAKGAAKGVDVAKVKTMQYNILNIPLENEKGLLGFYDRLKKMRVSFAELPDLQLGDSYTQIVYNPMDAENVKMVVQYYRKQAIFRWLKNKYRRNT